jgi:hypothetical protein
MNSYNSTSSDNKLEGLERANPFWGSAQ